MTRPMNPTVYELWHERHDDRGQDHDKLLGVYSARNKAEEQLGLLRDKPGFRDHPDGFDIRPGGMDCTAWTNGGFVTVWGDEAADEPPLAPFPKITEEQAYMPSVEPMPPVYWTLWLRFVDEWDYDHELIVGTYTSRQNAQKGIELLRDQPGFRDHPGGFAITQGTLDQTDMTNGFVTVRENDREHDEPIRDAPSAG